LIKFSQALLFSWGQTNVYFYSYYKNSDPSLDYKVKLFMLIFLNNKWISLFIIIIALPIASIQVFSMRLAVYFGYQRLIFFGMCLLTIGSLLSSFMPNFYLFMFTYLFIIGISYALAAFPTLACVWSYYPDRQG
jgi:MFS family permease